MNARSGTPDRHPLGRLPRRRLAFRARDGVVLMADSYGEDTHPPVLLIHGGGQTRHAWGRTASLLADAGFRAISLDLRGHGESGWSPEGAYGLERLSDDLIEFAATLSQRPALVGASLGGIAALCGLARRPFGTSLVLVDIAPQMESLGVERVLSFLAMHQEGFESLEDAVAAVRAYLPHRPQRTVDGQGLMKNLRRTQSGRLMWHWDPRFVECLPTSPERAFGAPMREAARTLTVPTLLVRGQRSDVLSEAGVRDFLRLVPHAQFIDLAAAGHTAVGDANDAFSAAIVAFLDANTPVAPAAYGVGRTSN